MKTQQEKSGGEVVFYRAPTGEFQLDVRLERETVWLNQRQIAELLGTSSDNVSLHLKNIFKEQELEERATTENSSVVQMEGGREIRRNVKYYNLDAILSVGYRVNSKRGTQFRIWATQTLKDHLLRGYTLNERRLREKGTDIEQAVALLGKTLTNNSLVTEEGRAVLDVVHGYTRAWNLLLAYDEERLPDAPEQPHPPGEELSLEQARAVIDRLRRDLATRGQVTALFGRERSDQLAGILGAIEQTFGGAPLYPSVESRAAHLLYFVIKDHPFSDGNKRIGTLLFLEYLHRNRLLIRADGTPRMADNAVVALALLVAESEPSQKELMVRLVLSLLGD